MSFRRSLSLLVGTVFLSSIALGQDALPPAAATPAPAAPGSPAAVPPPAVYPLDLVGLASGDVVVVDRNLPGLWKRTGEELKPLVTGPKKYRQPLNAARAVAVDNNGKILVSDTSTREIYRLDDSQQPVALTGGKIGIPQDLAVRADGSIMVADMESHSLLRVSADGKEIKTVAKVNPRGVFVDKDDKVWVVSQDAQQLQVVADDGTSKAIVDKRTFDFPHQVVVNAKGEAFVTDGYKKALWKIAPGAAPEVAFSGAPLDNPVGLALINDEVIVVDPRAATVFRFKDGKLEPWFNVK